MKRVLITGGCGFIGTNLAHRLLSQGHRVRLFDNLSRPGVSNNLRWLRYTHGENVAFEIGDVRDRYALRQCLHEVDQVFHFAAQVAVTTSVNDPLSDFEINAHGTVNLLEELRALSSPPPLVFTSTNKVYGALDGIAIECDGTRYFPADAELRARGIGEGQRLDFQSPYGCSKGAADQYVLDYARVYNLPAVVFRMSCIYGPHQFGNEDQGWIAHFLIRAIEGEPVTIFGDGRQVRDALFVEDLVDAFEAALKGINAISGRAFNIGGGPGNTLSLLELNGIIRELHGAAPRLEFRDWRTGDQRYYVSDTSAFSSATGWKPRTGVKAGIEQLYRWLVDSRASSLPTLTAGRSTE